MNGVGQTVPLDQYNYALTNFRIAHDEVEKQRRQLEEQERQVAALRERIATLEGGQLNQGPKVNNRGTSTVDDQSIRQAASRLAAHMNRWAAEIVRAPPVPLNEIRDAILTDLYGYQVKEANAPASIQVQNLLRHILSEAIAEGIINCLIVTNSTEANIHLTRIHDQLFSRDPLVACVWRRQTFSAAVESFTPELAQTILSENLHSLGMLLSRPGLEKAFQDLHEILNAAYSFSRMLHAGQAGGGGMDAFYRAFVPELGHPLDPGQLELTRRCMKSERGEVDLVGATVFPGLVKVTLAAARGKEGENTIATVVKRAQVICQCALVGVPTPQPTPANGPPPA
ncbi:hypothetical protein DACRYDRAFT_76177 [Dacryopinax primogenitus]|uniref:Uncharacterized protein n=1 Tax=Dacryopinax primogenitus (strain DJM 731) TaxID=1858805 RepID=M5G4C9_DACPD|nr:uncharacterized protein DACRYDRAFT_76177 [Dacryopinax primogenitus]EJU05116.1 hypothetical protein DACRYDRAFT_76177 [Dacryopinax primogenitus]